MKALGRLAALYGRMERMEAVAARLAADRAERAAEGCRLEQACGCEQQSLARAALMGGDRTAWLVAARVADLSKARMEGLTKLRVTREQARDAAMEKYMASRVKTEQMTRALERLQAAETLCETRRDQAAADDRFLSRVGWTRAQDEMKGR